MLSPVVRTALVETHITRCKMATCTLEPSVFGGGIVGKKKPSRKPVVAVEVEAAKDKKPPLADTQVQLANLVRTTAQIRAGILPPPSFLPVPSSANPMLECDKSQCLFPRFYEKNPRRALRGWPGVGSVGRQVRG